MSRVIGRGGHLGECLSSTKITPVTRIHSILEAMLPSNSHVFTAGHSCCWHEYSMFLLNYYVGKRPVILSLDKFEKPRSALADNR
jgi:hypothetical protein